MRFAKHLSVCGRGLAVATPDASGHHRRASDRPRPLAGRQMAFRRRFPISVVPEQHLCFSGLARRRDPHPWPRLHSG
jgi:hypothetical protein